MVCMASISASRLSGRSERTGRRPPLYGANTRRGACELQVFHMIRLLVGTRSSPRMRRCPQPGFSRAKRSTRSDLVVDARSARPVRVGPMSSEQPPVPGQQGSRSDDAMAPQRSRQCLEPMPRSTCGGGPSTKLASVKEPPGEPTCASLNDGPGHRTWPTRSPASTPCPGPSADPSTTHHLQGTRRPPAALPETLPARHPQPPNPRRLKIKPGRRTCLPNQQG